MFAVDLPHGGDAAALHEHEDEEDDDEAEEGYVEGSALVDAQFGGVVQAGRFKLLVPPGALAQDTEIVVRDVTAEEGGIVTGELLPEGLTFLKPVYLQVDLEGTTAEGWSDANLFWYDPDTGQWVDQGGFYSPWTHKLWAPLEHFSRYRPGRAGW
jgi:hypothetical protein